MLFPRFDAEQRETANTTTTTTTTAVVHKEMYTLSLKDRSAPRATSSALNVTGKERWRRWRRPPKWNKDLFGGGHDSVRVMGSPGGGGGEGGGGGQRNH